MRKLWCAGALAGGILLGATPAWADDTLAPAADAGPGAAAPATGQDPAAGLGAARTSLRNALGYALEPGNAWRFAADPLSGQPLLQVEPGTARNAPSLEDHPDGRRNARSGRRLLPAADVIRGTVPAATRRYGASPSSSLPVPVSLAGLLSQNFPSITGLGPSGVSPAAPPANTRVRRPAPDERPFAPRLEHDKGDYALLGGLAGANPVRMLDRDITDLPADVAGMPLGGELTDPNPADKKVGDSKADDPKSAPEAPDAGSNEAPSRPKAIPGDPAIDDPRLHEEPVDGFVDRSTD
ncbi:hypothetical protein GCM10010112_52720 [Actinoplanes lobatus]|uniref:Uncharacterized protein n=1 Tax=Actinoplanes lobatus TaxID=113568 RepID=A0A7W7HBF6_9ACTN|nr:hypothetical protein [Actinoplanes lobatus]MBB4747444.1 hypothetical protein [Actinoplanes lobatus]GGN78699.1 hypothetical protein GCM10010112_52720 [Actinoplanes lobatus]GIE42585.1 hypothetical protein Alo02nite_54830 [Actinoplanes lobatus]